MGQISPEVWQSMVDTNGEPWARNFVEQSGDEPPDAYSAQSPSQGAPADEEDDEAPAASGLSVTQLQNDIVAQQRQDAAARKARFEKAKDALAKQHAGPPLSERLMALSASFFQPKQFSGFSGTMANLMPTLAKESAAVRQGNVADAEKLQALQDKYDVGEAAAADKNIGYQLQLAKLLKQGSGMGVWSEANGRFMPKDRPVIVKAGTKDGKQVHQYSDGTMHVSQPDGTFGVYDIGGNRLGTADARGNPINATS